MLLLLVGYFFEIRDMEIIAVETKKYSTSAVLLQEANQLNYEEPNSTYVNCHPSDAYNISRASERDGTMPTSFFEFR